MSDGPVYDREGYELRGMDKELFLKAEAKRDANWEAKVANWIETVTKEKLAQKSDLFASLKDGIMLCTLVNALVPGTIPRFNTGRDLHGLLINENVNVYLKACYELGVHESSFFQASDLVRGRSMNQVVQNIGALCRTAIVSHGWTGVALAPVNTATNTVKKWAAVETAPRMRHAADMDNENDVLELELAELNNACSLLKCVLGNIESELAYRAAEKQKTQPTATAVPIQKDNNNNSSVLKKLKATKKELEVECGKLSAKNKKLRSQLSATEEEEKGEVPRSNKRTKAATRSALDAKQLAEFGSLLQKLVTGGPVHVSETSSFSSEAARRSFSFALASFMRQKQFHELSESSYDVLKHIFCEIMGTIDTRKCKSLPDYLTAYSLMDASSTISCNGRFLREDLGSYSIWRSVDYWTQSFSNWMSSKLRNAVEEERLTLMKTLLMSFLMKMMDWGASHPKMTRQFLTELDCGREIRVRLLTDLDELTSSEAGELAAISTPKTVRRSLEDGERKSKSELKKEKTKAKKDAKREAKEAKKETLRAAKAEAKAKKKSKAKQDPKEAKIKKAKKEGKGKKKAKKVEKKPDEKAVAKEDKKKKQVQSKQPTASKNSDAGEIDTQGMSLKERMKLFEQE